MDHSRKRHNWKARRNVQTKIDKREQRNIDVKLKDVEEEHYDESNALVLPSKKRNTSVKIITPTKVKRLSKKQRKRLEKIVEVKEKKLKRADLLKKLTEVQATSDELNLLTSISEVHSGRPKRKVEIEQTSGGEIKVSALSGSNKKRQKISIESDLVSSSSEEDLSSSEEDEGDAETIDIEQGLETTHVNDLSTDEKVAVPDTTIERKEEKPVLKDKKHLKEMKQAVHVTLSRKPHAQEERLKLPIAGEEQIIMEAINDHPVVIICGETGSGKTTQVPQFLYEAGYTQDGKMIGVTEPRRVAAISMSKRVAHEMNVSSRQVSYQIRYAGNVTEDTQIKFMTDGVLLKEVQKDFLLMKYKVIIIDEAHERSVYTDILIGLLSRIVPLRHKKGKPLKLIIMSATLRVEDFTENQRLFKVSPPVIKVDARQFPVTIHFNKHTPAVDYLDEAYRKVCKIHRQLPDGGILVFVTGQQEIHTLCAKLRKTFPFTKDKETNCHKSEKDKTVTSSAVKKKLPEIHLEDYSVMPLDEEAELHVPDHHSDNELSDDAINSDKDEDCNLDTTTRGEITKCEHPVFTLPLYSLLSADKQSKVFDPPPAGSRLVVVATNVAETSLTIPNIKYVVDTGKVKTKCYDKVTGVSTFRVTWTSKASADQRAGRAGRTGPGHSYRLYSSAMFNDVFEQFSLPEISQRPVDDLVLQMKDMCIDRVMNFPFPTPPSTDALKAAERLLISLGALEKPPAPKSFKESQNGPSTKITSLGRTIASFPVAPRYGKMLSLGHQHHLLPYVILIVAALSVQEIFVDIETKPTDEEEEDAQKQRRLKSLHLRRTWAGSGQSLLLGDLMVLLKAVGAWEYAGGDSTFCDGHGLHYKAMCEIRKLRAQLTNTVNSVISDTDVILDPQMKPPTDLQARLLRQIVLAGLGDHVARKLPEPPKGVEDAKKLKFAYQSLPLEEPVFIHPGSVLYRSSHEYVVYQSVEETSKLYMKGVSAMEADWLPLFVANHCQFSKPAEDPSPRFDQATGNVSCHMSSTFGPHFWPLPSVELDYPDGLDRYKWFARFLLEGKVFPKLERFTPVLFSAPITMIKAWAKLQPRTEKLLNALIAESAYSRDRLLLVWDKKPKYLLKTYCEWIPEALHKDLTDIWPPL